MVDEAMASATRVHAIERGLELGERALVATGGAAPLHAARLAQKLGLRRVIIPRDAGVGSAVGFLRAPIAYSLARSRLVRLREWDEGLLGAFFQALGDDASRQIAPMSHGRPIRLRWLVDARYVGQGHEILLELDRPPTGVGASLRLRACFEAAYRQHYHRLIPDHEVECLNWLVVASVEGSGAGTPRTPAVVADGSFATAMDNRELWDPASGKPSKAAVFHREALGPGAWADGPAVIVEQQTTTVVPRGFRFICASNGDLILERREP
jgi:N-methylhydantoinase A